MITTHAFSRCAALVACLLLAVPGLSAAQEPPAAPAAAALPSIVVTKAAMRPIVDQVLATGTLQPMEEVHVAPLVEGLSIRALNADIGDRVEAGQTIATLNDDMLLLQKSQYEASLAKVKAALAQYQAQLAEAQANFEEAVRVNERSRKLSQAGTLSAAVADRDRSAETVAQARVTSAEQQIAVANADIAVAQSQIADVDLRLGRTAIKAPVAGIVANRTARIGAIASGSATPLFTIIRDGVVEMKADVSEADLTGIAIGQTAKVSLADGRTILDGAVRLVSPTVDAQTRLGTVYIRLLQPEKARVGMYASARIIVAEKQAIVLPLTAVTVTREKTVARRIENGVVRVVSIETGIQDGKFIEVTKGLSAGDAVVVKAGAYVRDGDRINPVEDAAAATTN